MVNVIPGIHRRMNVLKVTKYVVFYSAKQFTRKMLITQGLVLRQKCATLSELWYSELLKLWQGVIQKELCLLFYLEKKDTCREKASFLALLLLHILEFRFQRAKNQSVTFFISFDEKRCQEACKQGSSQERELLDDVLLLLLPTLL